MVGAWGSYSVTREENSLLRGRLAAIADKFLRSKVQRAIAGRFEVGRRRRRAVASASRRAVAFESRGRSSSSFDASVPLERGILRRSKPRLQCSTSSTVRVALVATPRFASPPLPSSPTLPPPTRGSESDKSAGSFYQSLRERNGTRGTHRVDLDRVADPLGAERDLLDELWRTLDASTTGEEGVVFGVGAARPEDDVEARSLLRLSHSVGSPRRRRVLVPGTGPVMCHPLHQCKKLAPGRREKS